MTTDRRRSGYWNPQFLGRLWRLWHCCDGDSLRMVFIKGPSIQGKLWFLNLNGSLTSLELWRNGAVATANILGQRSKEWRW